MSEVEELRRFGNAVVHAWERWGRCIDEFPPDEYPGTCGEWLDALDTAIIDLNRIINEHAMTAADAARPATGERDDGEGER